MSSFPGTCPMSLFRAGVSRALLTRGTSAVGRGTPGDVGGLARGAELIECTPRLCELLVFGDSGVRMFVNVIVTENCSPAK